MNAHISTTSMLFMGISGLVAILAPILILIYFRVRKKADISPFFIGCAIFVGFVFVLENVLHWLVLQKSGTIGQTIQGNIILFGIYGGLAAGIFEEFGRLFAFKVLMKKRLKPQNALSYGVGHGGIESILIVGLTMVSSLVMSVMVNSGQIQSILGTGSTRDALLAQITALAQVPSYQFLLSGVERLAAITLHISLSVLVFAAVTIPAKKFLFPVAIALHAGIDFVAVVLGARGLNINAIGIEAIVVAYVVPVALFAAHVYRNVVKTFDERNLVMSTSESEPGVEVPVETNHLS